MVRLSEVGAGGSVVGALHVAVDVVHNVVVPHREAHMLVVLGEDSPKVAVVKIPCHNKHSVRVCSLVFADGVVQ